MIAAPADAVTTYRSSVEPRPERFGHLVRAEWTKFRTVRGWVIAMIAAAVVTVLLGFLFVPASMSPCGGGPNCAPPLGPDGEAVNDGGYFVRQALDGDGSITVRVTSLSVLIQSPDGGSATTASSGEVPWAKAGIMIKASATPGSPYAAIMVTADHGVRMQYDYTHDIAASSGTADEPSQPSPRWLRLTRSGEVITGSESSDGSHWTPVSTVRLPGLASSALVGMFVASPQYEVDTQSIGRLSSEGGPSQATAAFDQVDLHGGTAGGAWSGSQVQADQGGQASPAAGFEQSNGDFTVTGSGDIGPGIAGPEGNTIEHSLGGVFVGLIIVIVVGAMFMAAEYRRGLIRVTLAASPRRGRVLAAKAIVIGGVTFVAGLAACTFADRFVGGLRRDRGQFILPVSALTEVRVVVGTAALLAVVAVMALALGTVLRRSASTVAAVIVAIVLPYILAVASVLPAGAADWLLRVTPAAGFAIQQSTLQYAQVSALYTPAVGFYPLAPWAGFAVLCAWAALALGLASLAMRRRDA